MGLGHDAGGSRGNGASPHGYRLVEGDEGGSGRRWVGWIQRASGGNKKRELGEKNITFVVETHLKLRFL